MNLVRWFRKNNKKVMAIVVIVIMVGFVGGSYLQQLAKRKTLGLKEAVAHIFDGQKITRAELNEARLELEILKMLGADILLRRVSVPAASYLPDMHAIALGGLLFADRTTSPQVVQRMKQLIRSGEYQISDKQINDIYSPTVPNFVYWVLLKKETERTGIRISPGNVGAQLGASIPQLMPGATYSQLVGAIVQRYGIPEEKMLDTYAKLLAVLDYSRMVCSTEDVTGLQLKQMTVWDGETFDFEFVEFSPDIFAEEQPAPTEQEIAGHFNMYKEYFVGDVCEENPWGLGYTLPAQVRLEYMVVRLDDVSKIVTPPTPEETEEYYQRHIAELTKQVPSDPNDPNSVLIEVSRSYAETAEPIKKQLLTRRINTKVETILIEARSLTEVGLENIDTETAALDSERFKKLAGDYGAAAEQLSKKYGVKVYTGKTGLLSALDIRNNRYLGVLYLQGSGFNVVRLPQAVFAIDELGTSELGPFDVSRPRMYENIGLLRDMTELSEGRGSIMAVMRVVEAQKMREPEDIDLTLSKAGLKFDPNQQQADDIYSVKEKVVEDLKKLMATEIAKSKADEFAALVKSEGWDSALKKFNEQYSRTEESGNKTDVFTIRDFVGMRKIKSLELGVMAAHEEGNPLSRYILNMTRSNNLLIDVLASVVPERAQTLETEPLVLEFKPDLTYYCLKSLAIKHVDKQEYEKTRALRIFRQNLVRSQSMAVVHFNPQNIITRTNFQEVDQDSEQTQAEESAESGEGA